MKVFNKSIKLVKNGRGCYILDTVKGCSVCGSSKPRGCYDDCYAKNIASRYGLDFSNPVSRTFDENKQIFMFDFVNSKHISDVIAEISNCDMPFVRIGDMGDPSEDWEHTLNVCSIISEAAKPVVIITKHWKTVTETMAQSIYMLNVCINTSISALDSEPEIEHRLHQYNRLKRYCNSALRVVTCSFNLSNPEGVSRDVMQNTLLRNDNVIETAFRPSQNNPLLTNGIIKASKVRFLKATCLASLRTNDVYLGRCDDCPDMCGTTVKVKELA